MRPGVRRNGRQFKGTARASDKPTTRDLEWAAGFLEGEGCFYRDQRRTGGLRVTVAQVNLAPLERLSALFGGNVRLLRRHTRNPRHKDCGDWTIFGNRAAGVMLTLYVLLSTARQAQIRKCLGGAT